MKKANYTYILLFFLCLIIPILTFNLKKDEISEIDNRKLADNPFDENFVSESGDLTEDIESYLQDRIGFRNEMISSYTVMNDKLFHKMVHPTYDYGKNDYVFFKVGRNIQFNEYHLEFIDMIEKIQTYCQERDIPFVFVFNPAKTSVLQNELKPGINYNNDWVGEFMSELDKREINYVDNSMIMQEKTSNGEQVFNKQYNAGHWNDLGAYYGVNEILKNLQNFYPNIHINKQDEFTISQKLNTSLQVSDFPIYEYEPIYDLNCDLENKTEIYSDEVERNSNYAAFGYYLNQERLEEGSPKVLVFQGSYMNGMGYKFLQNSLGEYIYVHDYQNVINFDYYFNIFKPDCVIFEVAEYTLSETYFDSENMKNMNLNPVLSHFDSFTEKNSSINDLDINVSSGNQLSKITISNPVFENTNVDYVYLVIGDEVFDFKQESGEYVVTIENARLRNPYKIISIDLDHQEKNIFQ